MGKICESMLNDIVKLGQSSRNKDQWDASQLMCKNVFPGGKCVDPTAIPRLLPTIVKLMESKAPRTQEEGIFFVTAITTTSNGPRTAKQNTQLVIDTGALPKLAKCLSSKSPGVLELALRCVGNIAIEFPEELSATGGIEASVVRLCGSLNDKICLEAIYALIAIINPNSQACQNILELNALKVIKKAFMREQEIASLAVKFLKIVVSFEEEDFTEMIIKEKFCPLIVRQMYEPRDDKLKAKAAKVIKNIVSQKPEVIPQLVEEEIIAVISQSLQSKNVKLLLHTLSILQQIIEAVGYEAILEKFENDNGPQHLRSLLRHRNVEIKQLAIHINSLVVDDDVIQPTVIGGRCIVKRGSSESEEIEDEVEESQQVAETPRSQRSAKRAAVQAAEQPKARSKRSKVSLEQTDTEPSGSVADDDNDLYNDFDDVTSHTPTPIRPILFELPNEMPPAPFENNKLIPETPTTGNEENAVVTTAINRARVADKTIRTGANENANQNGDTFNRTSDESVSALNERSHASAVNENRPISSNEPSTSKLFKIGSNIRFADVFFVTSDGKRIPSHRNILAEFSESFTQIFEETSVIPVLINVEDFEAEIIQSTLHFLYDIPDAIIGKEMEIFKFAVKFRIQHLIEACRHSFEESVSPSNVCEVVKFASENNLEELKQKCLQILLQKKKEIDSTKVLLLPKKILLDIYLFEC